jgi:hypothetical protein
MTDCVAGDVFFGARGFGGLETGVVAWSKAQSFSLFSRVFLTLWLAFSVCHPALSASVAYGCGDCESAQGTLKADRADPSRLVAQVWPAGAHQLTPARSDPSPATGPAGEWRSPLPLESRFHQGSPARGGPGLPVASGQGWRFVQRTELRPRAPSRA